MQPLRVCKHSDLNRQLCPKISPITGYELISGVAGKVILVSLSLQSAATRADAESQVRLDCGSISGDKFVWCAAPSLTPRLDFEYSYTDRALNPRHSVEHSRLVPMQVAS
jgi:hypothetical protein